MFGFELLFDDYYITRFLFGIEFCLDDILITSWNLYYLYLASRFDLMTASSSCFSIPVLKSSTRFGKMIC